MKLNSKALHAWQKMPTQKILLPWIDSHGWPSLFFSGPFDCKAGTMNVHETLRQIVGKNGDTEVRKGGGGLRAALGWGG